MMNPGFDINSIVYNMTPSFGRRRRTVIDRSELEKLEKVYAENNWPDRLEKQDLAAELNKTEQFVSIWFQNKRARMKKHLKESVCRPESSVTMKTFNFRFPTPSSAVSSPFQITSSVSDSMSLNRYSVEKFHDEVQPVGMKEEIVVGSNLSDSAVKVGSSIGVRGLQSQSPNKVNVPKIKILTTSLAPVTDSIRDQDITEHLANVNNCQPRQTVQNRIVVTPQYISQPRSVSQTLKQTSVPYATFTRPVTSCSLARRVKVEVVPEPLREPEEQHKTEYEPQPQLEPEPPSKHEPQPHPESPTLLESIIRMAMLAEGELIDPEDYSTGNAINHVLYGIGLDGGDRLVHTEYGLEIVRTTTTNADYNHRSGAGDYY